MITARNGDTHALQLTRVFDAPIRLLFDCFTDPALIMQWWGPEGTLCPAATSELRAGGGYRFVIEDPESGARYIACGHYLIVEAPNRLVFTWYWESEPEEVTQVSIEFRPIDETHTELRLEHVRFPDLEGAQSHESGWTSSLARLTQLLARSQTR